MDVTTHDKNVKLIRKYICGLISDNEYFDGSNIKSFSIQKVTEKDTQYTKLTATIIDNRTVSFMVRIPDGNITLSLSDVKLITSINFNVIKSFISFHLKNIFYYELIPFDNIDTYE